ncbi:5104_t:CDS:10 [Diversispora eburnea]|uniref:5104_t:CDS:1 n=1 Tax=Diversispora eburnea TaxID=1213867 RepID=A0A9N8WNQ9_9GLOM|nr:5104_t:CDS:10 [Diversispora eburnea]
MASARNQLLITLSEAASQQLERIKVAEAQLKQWEIAPEFYSTLLDIIFDRSIDGNIRFLGAIFFKNGVDCYWRKSAKNTIDPIEKSIIRGRLLSFMDEEFNQIAVLVSKIARLDFPNEWPELLQNLLSIIHSTLVSASNPQTVLIQKRSLLTLHLVVKSLCSKTIGADRKIFEQVAPELLRNVASIYVEHVNRFFTMVSLNDIGISVDLETSLSALKCIRRLTVYGFRDISKVEETKAFFALILEHLQKFHTLRNALEEVNESPITKLVESHIILMGKFYIDIIKAHTVAFILTPGSVDVISFYWKLVATYGKSYEKEKYLVQALLLMKSLIRKTSYNQDLRESKDLQVIDAIRIVDEQILTPSFVESFAELLMTSLISLRKEDLMMWEEDPEASQTNNLLLKDAVYCAIGLGAHELYDELDFDSWLVNNLLVEIANNDPNYKIIRRRIAWVIGRWICVKISKENKPKAYDAMTYLLNPEEDLVFTHCHHMFILLLDSFSLRVDEWDFDSERFATYLDRAVTLLTRLIGDVKQFDSRMKILNCLSLIVERMEKLISPFAEKITNLLPPLWQAAQDEHMFRPAILSILTKLVQALMNESINLHDFIIPIIQYSVNPNTEEHVYLLEDALDLWLATLENSVECTPGLFSLVPAVIGLLECGSENLKKVLKILERDLKPEACRAIIHVLDVIFQTCPFSSLGETIVNTGLLWKIIKTLLTENEEYIYVLVNYISILARLVLIGPDFIINFLSVAGQQYNMPQHNLLHKVLEVWLEKFDNIGHPKQRKLNAMAFATLISTTNPIILGYLPHFIGVWCDVLSEVKESEDISTKVGTEEADDTPETKRKRALLQKDPIHTTNLIQFIQLKLAECEALNGGTQEFNLHHISKIDKTLLDQLNGLMQY